MDDLVKFVRTQLDRIESGHYARHSEGDGPRQCAQDQEVMPCYTLRDVESKRALLDAWPDPMGQWTAEQADAARAVKERLYRLLAAAYADRPGYRPEWSP